MLTKPPVGEDSNIVNHRLQVCRYLMMIKNAESSPPSPVCIILQEPQTYFDLLTKVHNFEVELYEKVCLYTHGRILKNVVIEER